MPFKTPSAAALAAVLVFLLSSCVFAQIKPGDKIPAFKNIPDTNGYTYGSSDFKNATALIVFFSIYSKSTDSLMDYLKTLYKRKGAPGGGGFVIIGINIDPGDKEVVKYIQKKKINFRVLLDSSLNVEDLFRAGDMPFLVLADDLKVAATWEGFSPSIKKSVDAAVDKTLTPGKPVKQAENGSSGHLDEKYKEKHLAAAEALFMSPSPTDGTTFLYISQNHVLWLFDAVERKRIEMATRAHSAAWSPDGKSIVFAKLENDGIWIKEITTEKTTRISTEGINPAWSKRDGLIAFIVPPSELWVYRISTNKSWRIAADGVAATWTKDGVLLIVQDAKKRLWVVSPYSRNSLLKLF